MEFEKLQKIIAEVLNVEEDEITMDTTFVDDLGADSLDCIRWRRSGTDQKRIELIWDEYAPMCIVCGFLKA